MTRTCSECSANRHGTCAFYSCDDFEVKCSEVKLCGALRSGEVRNGWDVVNAPSGLRWVWDRGDWMRRERWCLHVDGRMRGFVRESVAKENVWRYFVLGEEICRNITGDTLKDCARALVAAVKEET